MKIYGHPWSVNTRKALTVAREKDVELELSVVHIPRGEQRSAAHLALHPFGKVPVLEDGDFRLYETMPILRYLDEVVDGPSLTPSTARARARAAQWDRVQQSYFEPRVHPLVAHRVFARHVGLPPDATVIQAGRDALCEVLDVLEPHLASAPFLAGGVLSVSDINWLPYLDYLTHVGEGGPIAERPHVAAWYARLSDRPSWTVVARTGMQPYDGGASADAIAREHGWRG
ncbi:MAG: glutathione S-transferase family protein [Sandaracinaceae bacterium]